ncbi:hypothetical protein F383_07824 [Gossypium arboreum]|uniref:Uncharacterized protein n=1 Tax=Gossypium arboreum TaxID=29729 RepID=A0A0B0P9S5_GOSAR|nr:hypothetical protein F383_07824 [Gossypium arboreum]
MSQCKTMSRTWHRHLTPRLRLWKYPIMFQMVQWRKYELKLTRKNFNCVVSGTGTYMICIKCELNICYMRCIEY